MSHTSNTQNMFNLPSLSTQQLQRTTDPHQDRDVSDVTNVFSSTYSRFDTIYSSLNSLENIEVQNTSRKELMGFYSVITNICERNSVETCEKNMRLFGLTEEDVLELQTINEQVSNGRQSLLKYLKEYEECEDHSNQLTQRMEAIKEAVHTTRYRLSSLEEKHTTFKELTDSVIEQLLEKETNALEDLQSQQGLVQIKKDKLECLINYLLKTYNILKSTQILHLCPVCLTNEIDVFLNPCGHTLCRSCCKITFCHMCRTKVKEIKSLYYS